MNLKAVILAGGKGERIGGNKPLVSLNGKPLIYWTLQNISSLFPEVFISVKTAEQKEKIQQALVNYNLRIKDEFFILDKDPRLMGPVSGIFSAMDFFYVKKQEKTVLLIMAVDQPFIPSSFLKKLISLSSIFFNFAIVRKTFDKINPFPGIYPCSLKEELEIFIKNSPKKSLFRFFIFLKKRNQVLFLEDCVKINENKAFLNINTPEDLKIAEKCFSLYSAYKLPYA